MKTDIKNREDIILLVDTFYNSLQQNNLLGTIFNEVAHINWEKHLPKMYDFWESILFGSAIYKGNPMLTHFDLQKKTPLESKEFETWKNLFYQTVENLFEGENANTIKQKAQSIADLMHFKLNAPTGINILK